MQGLGEALKDAITSMTNLACEEYHCSICGQLVPQVKMMLPSKNGMVEKSFQPYCKCEVADFESGMNQSANLHREREIERKFSISALGERFAECNFDNFTVQSGAENALKYARIYANSFPDHGADALLIWGDVGNGKSHLAASVCHVLKAKGYTIVFQSVPEALERIRSTFRGGKNTESEKEIMDALLDCRLLVLDDIGAEKVSDWVQDIMFRIVDGRYRQKRPIFYTSNLAPGELQERLGPRIYDCMMETSVPIQNSAASFRRERARKLSEDAKNKRGWSE